MKKILTLLLFIPLVLLSIYLGYSQINNKKTIEANINSNIETNISANEPTVSPASTQINLVISYPQSNTTVTAASIEVRGTTGSKVHVVLNEQELTSEIDGSFKSTIPLDEGDNYISVVAYDDLGNTAERELLITRTIAEL